MPRQGLAGLELFQERDMSLLAMFQEFPGETPANRDLLNVCPPWLIELTQKAIDGGFFCLSVNPILAFGTSQKK